ncbi:MAG: hypothetical protein HQ463_02205 [Bacteroidetes bacterium]|nr:hypothetical protein [Bacteroidota bacterium]
MDFKYLTKELSFILICLFFISCKDKNCDIIYNPIIHFKASTEKDTIKIGDTLIFESKSSNFMLDKRNGSLTNYKNYKFNFLTNIYHLNDTSKFAIHPNVTNSFKITDIIGTHEVAGESGFFIKYESRNDSILFKFLIIPQNIGLFGLNCSNNVKHNAHGNNNIKLTDTKCKEYLENVNTLVNFGNTNHYLIDLFNFSYLDENQKWSTKNAFYYFYVKP